MVALKLMNPDTLFHKVSMDKIILNDYVIKTTDDVEELKLKLATIYESDTISLLPRCNCGDMEGEMFRDTICSICDTPVRSIYDDVDPFLWFKNIESTEKFINPEFWCIVKKAIGGSIDFLRWISDTQYNPPVNTTVSQRVMNIIKNIQGFERSYIWLVKNMKTLLITLSVTLKDQKLTDSLKLFKEQNKYIFSKYLPLQNKRMFILESAAKSKYITVSIVDVLDTIMFFIKNCESKSQKKLEQVMARTCSELANIHDDAVKTYLTSKGGIPRKHINGFRSYFTSRAVIVPIVRDHKYDEVEMPWSATTVMMRPHILNKLLKRGYSYIVSNNMLYKCVHHYDQVINDIIDELLDECPYNGFPITMNRNPSLLNGSTQVLYMKVKRIPYDKTIGFPVLVAKNPNAKTLAVIVEIL